MLDSNIENHTPEKRFKKLQKTQIIRLFIMDRRGSLTIPRIQRSVEIRKRAKTLIIEKKGYTNTDMPCLLSTSPTPCPIGRDQGKNNPLPWRKLTALWKNLFFPAMKEVSEQK